MSAASGRRSAYVVAVGLLGALAGGWWLGLVLLVLSSPSRQLLDAGALIAAVAALCGVYSLVEAAGGGPLRLFSAFCIVGGLLTFL
jgi:hypothetical protein